MPTASPRQTLLVFAGMVLSIALAWTLRAAVLEDRPRALDGPLKPYVVARADAPACSGAACAVPLVLPQAGIVTRVQPVRYEPPDVEVLAAPAGHALVPVAPALLYTPGSSARQLPFVAKPWPAHAKDDAPSQALKVYSPGWVRAGRELRSGALVDFALARSLPAGSPQAYAELRFQPISTGVNVLLQERWQPGPRSSDSVWLHFVPPSETAPAPIDAPIKVRVNMPDAADRSGMMNLYMDPGDIYRLLEQRFAGTEPREPLPRQMWLEWRDAGDNSRPRQWRVPASSVQRDGEGARVWLALEGRAIPVSVTELEQGASHSVVAERPGAWGLPVRTADWKALGSAGRAAAYQAAAAAYQHLLQPNARLLATVPEGLAPGAPVGAR
jgi:hypothetical protein